MGKYDEDIREKLGTEFVKTILDAVRCGEITKQNMEDIAQGLGPKIRGGHIRRGEIFDAAEMRRILSDWYEDDLCNQDTEQGIQKLIALFESDDISLKPLAARLKKYVDEKIEQDKETIQARVCDKLGSVVIDMINDAVKDGAITRNKMDAIARGLGRHLKIQNWDNEMERILRVWFRKTPLELDVEKKKALTILAKIFEKQDVNLTSLARKPK